MCYKPFYVMIKLLLWLLTLWFMIMSDYWIEFALLQCLLAMTLQYSLGANTQLLCVNTSCTSKLQQLTYCWREASGKSYWSPQINGNTNTYSSCRSFMVTNKPPHICWVLATINIKVNLQTKFELQPTIPNILLQMSVSIYWFTFCHLWQIWWTYGSYPVSKCQNIFSLYLSIVFIKFLFKVL